jgi:hypothetical protein
VRGVSSGNPSQAFLHLGASPEASNGCHIEPFCERLCRAGGASREPAVPTSQGALIRPPQLRDEGVTAELPSHACRPDKTLHRGTGSMVFVGHSLLRMRNPVEEGSAPVVTRLPSLRTQQVFESPGFSPRSQWRWSPPALSFSECNDSRRFRLPTMLSIAGLPAYLYGDLVVGPLSAFSLHVGRIPAFRKGPYIYRHLE